jgi:hypothetical protein
MKVFFPIRCIDVPASPPHDQGTAYRVSYGVEHWGPEPTYVYKVQIAHKGIVSGRRSPSFPADADDFERVCQAMAELRRGGSDGGRKQDCSGRAMQNIAEEQAL